MSKDKRPSKKHHFLITGEMVFISKDAPDVMNGIRLNAIVTNDNGNFPAKLIGRAQQALQMHFYKRYDLDKHEVLDVVLLNVVDIGYMTDEEFQAQPPEAPGVKAAAEQMQDAIKQATAPKPAGAGAVVGKSTPGLRVVGKEEPANEDQAEGSDGPIDLGTPGPTGRVDPSLPAEPNV